MSSGTSGSSRRSEFGHPASVVASLRGAWGSSRSWPWERRRQTASKRHSMRIPRTGRRSSGKTKCHLPRSRLFPWVCHQDLVWIDWEILRCHNRLDWGKSRSALMSCCYVLVHRTGQQMAVETESATATTRAEIRIWNMKWQGKRGRSNRMNNLTWWVQRGTPGKRRRVTSGRRSSGVPCVV